jgi:hypothetical protein
MKFKGFVFQSNANWAQPRYNFDELPRQRAQTSAARPLARRVAAQLGIADHLRGARLTLLHGPCHHPWRSEIISI